MKKVKTLYMLYTILFIIISVFIFYLYIGLQFGKGVSKMGKDLHRVKNEWKKNKENPLDSIENNVIKIIDSVKQTR